MAKDLLIDFYYENPTAGATNSKMKAENSPRFPGKKEKAENAFSDDTVAEIEIPCYH